jgi:hypothetical protein
LEQQSQNASDLQQASAQLHPEHGEQLSAEQQSARQSQFDRAAEKFRAENEPFGEPSLDRQQATADDLETLRQANQLLTQTDRLRAVISQQRDLANRMSEMAGRPELTPSEQARADRFAKEQELLEQELSDLQRELDRAAAEAQKQLPKMSASARELSEAIRRQEIGADQQAAASQARSGHGEEARQAAEQAARKLEALQSEAGQCEQCQGLGDSLDGPLSLPRDRLGNCLRQMAQGRKVPGLGQRGQQPGSGQAQGQGSGQGAGEGQGQAGDAPGLWRPGQSFSGSQARMQVLGPQHAAPEDRRPSRSSTPAEGRGQLLNADAGDLPTDAESLNPATRESSGSSTGALRGVPVGYRDAAEAYFRRLNEEPRAP